MLGSGDPTPYDTGLVILLSVLASVLAIGAARAGMWNPYTATGIRRAAILVALGATGAVMLRTPTSSGIVGAGRLLSVWPALAVVCAAYLIWSVRGGRP